jgi:putative spermidine/putrescine transport system substrate-binding protein
MERSSREEEMAKRSGRTVTNSFMPGRRSFLAGSVLLAGSVAMPAVLRGAAAGKVFIRTTGGSAEEGFRRAWYGPFQEATGIEMVPVVVDASKVMAMVEAGNVSVDITSHTVPELTILVKRNALERLDYGRFTLSNPRDLDRYTDYWMAKSVYATLIGYNKETFSSKHPTNWAEFWDVGKYPGRRMLQDASAEYPNLEQALLADGVPMDKLYPLDVDRAFKMLREIKPQIVKFWDSGAVAAQLLSDRIAVLGSIWESRILPIMKAGAPVDIEWNQAMRNPFGMGIVKGAPNKDFAYKAMDFGQSPKVQAAIAKEVFTAPASKLAYEFMDPALAQTLSSYPDHAAKGFVNNGEWWAENLIAVRDRWREFLLE